MQKIKKDTRLFPVRLWDYQKERAPIFAMLIMATLIVGIFYIFSDHNVRNYVISIFIVVLYLIQTRTSDEKKDFEHDNKYHKDRPVQRGVVSLKELYVINISSIIPQLLLYVSFLSLRILIFGLLSQGYAFLTRKEFFVRDWIREHFFTYYATHYFQLIILNLAILTIVKPTGVAWWILIAFVMLNIIIVELGRKMFAVEDDTTDDTFSAQLGHKGSAVTTSLFALTITLIAFYFINLHGQRYIYIIAPIIGMGVVFNSAYHYAIEPDRTGSKNIRNASILMLLTATVGVILGAY
jgi:4-hydroxybenzoate polyprenyltransferase